ncbi:hypothetical protein Mp_1g03360 [Marchantia polymorpha subsp. ruderalis]|uniref:Uncharacterized protein n=2 Tax=Marchantia polymorpha TaxID=3197 RepID=A0AAF6AL26_MARPO|nr:hypothetical protein MARPO_0005s0271 [Marchantia polymorpha]PTQ48660.1 hypothetical protein MARPO_0005s0271 [Marchantia polymorpha]BBM97145.1 hypothetical protein Mp_1g03360 [Marchantia polymorpha subsp. ruderalis]BBM97146.1 hypothetical protein Mp_1g03360 [Marchantia polymorpha subsp. ruderalis]|eukprot:PTQ48659.1 hypothetical protein MARPO_0005s0271 [Marchantia polymorpha]
MDDGGGGGMSSKRALNLWGGADNNPDYLRRINSRRCDSLHNGTHRWGRMMYGGMGLIPDISFDADTFNRIRGARGPK